MNKFNFPKEYILLILGAGISIVTTLIINNVNNKHDQAKQDRSERIDFADSLMKGLSRRFSYVNEFYNAETNKDSTEIHRWKKLCDNLELITATNAFYNTSRLRILFSDSLERVYHKSLDDPLYYYNVNILDTPFKKIDNVEIHRDRDTLDSALHRFGFIIYKKAFKEN